MGRKMKLKRVNSDLNLKPFPKSITTITSRKREQPPTRGHFDLEIQQKSLRRFLPILTLFISLVETLKDIYFSLPLPHHI
jgi:hypothetical protein